MQVFLLRKLSILNALCRTRTFAWFSNAFCQRKQGPVLIFWFMICVTTLPILFMNNQFLLLAAPFTDTILSLLLGQFLLVGCICANVVIRVIYVRIYYTYYYYYLCTLGNHLKAHELYKTCWWKD